MSGSETTKMMQAYSRAISESTFRFSTHIGSTRHNVDYLQESADIDFDTHVLLHTKDPELETASKILNQADFCELVILNQQRKVSSAAIDISKALTVDPPSLLAPLRVLSEAHRLPVAGLTETQRSAVRSALSDCLAHAATESGILSGWFDVALTTARNNLATRLVNSHGDISSTTDFELLSLTLTICQNYSDSDVTGSLSVAMATDGVNLVRMCREILSALSADHVAGRLHQAVENLLRQCISIPYNLYFKQQPKVTSALSQFKLVQCTRPYLNSPDEDVRLASYLLLVFACSETQAANCLAETRLVELLINRLRLALQASDRRCQGYHCVELAKCALRMARNDTNKEQLVDSGLLTLLTDMMSGGRADEQLVAMETALCLSFSSACVPRIREQCRAGFNTIRRLSESGETDDKKELTKELRLTMEAMDFNLDEGQTVESLLASRLFSQRCLATRQEESDSDKEEDEDVRQEGPIKKPIETVATQGPHQTRSKIITDVGHVMISYHQASSSDLAIWLKDRLQEAGLSVWLDRDSMQGSALECMAQAVESAAVMLLCLSRGYKDSNSCRMEAEYALRRGKRILTVQAEPQYTPDGWLGLLVGSQIILDFSKPDNWSAALPNLMRALQPPSRDLLRSTSPTAELQNLPAQPPQPPPSQSCNFLPLQPPQPPPSQSRNFLPPQPPQPSPSQSHNFLPPKPSQPPPSQALLFLSPNPPHHRAYTNWSAERVSDWLRARGLSPHLEPFRLTGEHLEFLTQLRREAPEAFYRMLETQLRLANFHDIFSFVRSLEALECEQE